MRIKSTYKMISISLIASALLVGCGGGSSTDTAVTAAKTFAGSVVKGPIDNATIILRDAAGEEVARSISTLGKFELPQIDLNSDYYTIESINGSYEDEATKQKVEVGESGLKTLLSKAQLQDIMANGKFAAMTPETTVFAELVKDAIENKGKSLVEASTEVKETIKRVFIDGTSPLTMLPGDKFLDEGDLTTDFPKDQTEAFARNRAISMSYMVRDLGLEPKEVFTIIQKIVEDLKPDGIINNSDLDNDGIDDNVTEDFGLARANLFQDTTSRLQRGELTDGQREELSLMGFDVDRFNGSLADAKASLDTEVKTYLVSTTLPTLHVLPTMTDEDGNATDAHATYTLTANTDVNVTIETPNGSWITPMWRYNNNPLPLIIRTNRGNAMTLNLDNKLDSNSTIHWHGFKIPAAMDGGPDTPVAAGSTKTYTFTMNQPAAPLWFHPHPDMETGKQVYMGLAGVYLLEDNITKTLETNNELPSGDKDTVLLVQDRRFDGNVTDSVRNLKYMDMEMDMDGMLGDTILVNGSVVPKQEVSNTMHRYRLYNVSNARNYKFALSDGSKFTVIGTDGGLLDTPTEVESITLGAAERVEIVIDFSKYNVGDKVMLVSQPFNGDMMGMMGGNMNGMNQKSDTRPTPGNDAASQDMNNSSQMTNDSNMSTNSQEMNNSEGNMTGMNQDMNGMGQKSDTRPTPGNGAASQDMNNSSQMTNDSNMSTNSQDMNNSEGNMTGMNQDMNGMGQNNMGSMPGMAANGAGLSIMRFDITSQEDETVTLYTELPEGAEIKTRHTAADTTNSAIERQFLMTMGGMGNMQNGEIQDGNGMSQGTGMQQMTFVINGKSFDPTRVDEFIEAGATEIWSIRNMSPMAHPFHAHAIQYQILSRNGVPATGTDLGWKDTFLVQPGETVKVIGKFEAINTGDYMYHCHILEHEDAGMMGYFRVGDTGVLGEQ